MEYRAVGNRCAVILDSLCLSIPREEVLAILNDKEFAVIEVDIIALARQCVVTSQWCYGAKFSEAPAVVDCSSLVKWLYGQRGIWLPRRPIQQRGLGEPVELEEITAGDLVFTSGCVGLYDKDPADSVGHVSIAVDDQNVICATKSGLGHGVIEIPRKTLLQQREFRGARRFMPQGVEVITFETPLNREVETADDIRWIILRSIGRK